MAVANLVGSGHIVNGKNARLGIAHVKVVQNLWPIDIA
jgi:hypothetical protein